MQNEQNDPVGDDAPEPGAPGAAPQDTQDASRDGAQDGAGARDVAADDTAARQLEEQRDKYLRLAADYDNFRKRAAKERADAGPRAHAEFARQLLDPLDDLMRFADLDPAQVDPKTVVDGANMVEKKLLKVLGSFGVTQIDPVGEPFDPNLHEAVTTEPAEHPEEDHVVSRVFQTGYLANGQLLRPARVVVKQWNG